MQVNYGGFGPRNFLLGPECELPISSGARAMKDWPPFRLDSRTQALYLAASCALHLQMPFIIQTDTKAFHA
jgi:hypothetical protein